MLRPLCAVLALLALPAFAAPSLLGPGDVTHGLHLLAQTPSAGLPPNPTRPEINARLVHVQQELDALPSRGPPMAMMIAGFASGAAGLGTFLLAGFVALFGSGVAGVIALVGLGVLVAGLIVGIIGAMMLGTVNTARQEPEARLTAEQTYLQGLLKLSDNPPPPPVPSEVQWSQPRRIVLAAF